MLQNLQYLNMPVKIILLIIILIVVSQIIGAIIDIKRDVAPGILHITKVMKQSKQSHEIIKQLPEHMDLLCETVTSLAGSVDRIEVSVKNNAKDILNLQLEHMRNTCLDFVSHVLEGNRRFTKEQWAKCDKIFKDYERIIAEYGMDNGEMQMSHQAFLIKYQEAILKNDFLI